jgi:protein ImuB
MIWLCIRLPALVSEALAADERAALERLAAWAYQWSSWVSYRLGSAAPPEQIVEAAPLLWLELSASRALFGEPEALLHTIAADLTRLGYSHVCALAPSPTAAALLTLLSEQRVVHTRAQLRARLERLPLALLELPAAILTALRSAGLRSIGEVLALPAAGLARRFGPEVGVYLGRLSAQISDPRPAWHLPPRYRARCEFGQELHETGRLLFSLQRLLLEFQGYLRARDCAVQRFTLELEHADHAPTRLTIGLSAPTRAAAQFLLLSRERLHDLVLSAPVRALSVSAEEFTAAAIGQLDGFSSAPQQLDEVGQLLDRLRARLGESAVQSLRPQADHRPERAWRASPVQPVRLSAASDRGAHDAPLRPCALLSSPRPLPAAPQLLSGPERIESGWWDGAEVLRDYYLAQVQGARAWVFQDLSQGGWYLHGLWV